MTTTINLVCRNPRHNHDARLVSRWDDGRDGAWKPTAGFGPAYGEAYAIIWGPSDDDPEGEMHGRYKFPCGAAITQERLHGLLDEARALGRTEITLG
ncbi:biodegradative arginine decarboxylase [Microbacterium sp. HM58-2]|nr:biodegradative arginine decarboxylase [Microbacterium sp. HM58-2]